VIIQLNPKLRINGNDGFNWTVQKLHGKSWSNLSYHSRFEWALEWILEGRLMDDRVCLDLPEAVEVFSRYRRELLAELLAAKVSGMAVSDLPHLPFARARPIPAPVGRSNTKKVSKHPRTASEGSSTPKSTAGGRPVLS
jgi:hypothetical protein